MTTPNFYADHLEHMVQGYAELAQIDVARDYVWDRVNELASKDPLMWGALPDMVTDRAKEIRNRKAK